MSRKVKKEISSMSFSMNKFYRRISTTKPSALILSLVAIGIAVFLFGGGLYDIIMKPLPAVYLQGRGFLFNYPQLSEQFITDSLIAMILYALGVAGLIVIYQSTKNAYKPRQAYMMFLVGVALLFLAYIFLESTIALKVTQ
jgi:hypothetical protein